MFKYHLISQHFNQQAKQVKNIQFIYEEIAQRMHERLDYIKLSPTHVLDLASGIGVDSNLLSQRYPKALVYKLDIAVEMLKIYHKPTGFIRNILYKNKDLICANAISLPIKYQSIDLVWSNLGLVYIDDIEAFFKEVRRVLVLGGTFLISGLAVDSLIQLREMGLSTYNFPDMHIIGDILVKLGFSNPVTDIEYITVEYHTLNELLYDMRIIGAGTANTLVQPITKTKYKELQHAFNLQTKNGKFPLTLEVFCAHAWKDKLVSDLPLGQQAIQFVSKIR